MSEILSASASNDTQSVEMSAAQVAGGRTLALFCYIFPIVSIVPLVQRSNAFSLYHARQGIGLFLTCLVTQFVLLPASLVLAMFKLGLVATALSLVVLVALLALVVIGVRNAWGGHCRPLPVFGRFAERRIAPTAQAA